MEAVDAKKQSELIPQMHNTLESKLFSGFNKTQTNSRNKTDFLRKEALKGDKSLNHIRQTEAKMVQKLLGSPDAGSACLQKIGAAFQKTIRAQDEKKNKAVTLLTQIKRLFEFALL